MIAAPEAIAAAATDLASIGSTIGAANAAAAANTTAVLAAGADQVSVAIAAAFGAHGQAYQALSAQAATFHIQFVQALTAGAGSYNGRRGRQRRVHNQSAARRDQRALPGGVGAPADR